MALSNISKSLKLQKQQADLHISGVAGFLFGVCLLAAIIGTIVMTSKGIVNNTLVVSWMAGWLILGCFFLYFLKVASQWEKAIVLRLGKFHRLAGPGLFLLIPIVDTLANWIDHRVMVTPFSAEKTLTKDTVPVDVDAVLFWVVWDAEKAALEVADYNAAIAWAAQTALREIIGQMMLADILVGTRQDGCRAAEDHRRAHHALGRYRAIRRDPGCDHPARSGRCHVPPGAGRA